MEELILDIPGHRVAYKRWHSQKKPVLLALHGWMDNAASFDFIAPLLKHYQVLAIDLPGHGLSSHKPVGTRYHLIDAVVDVIAVADALRLERFSLLGHSLGGSIFTLLAAVVPERVQALGLLDALGPIATPVEDTLSQCRKGIVYTKKLKDTRQPSYESLEKAIEARERSLFLPKRGMENIVKRGTETKGGRWMWRHDVRIKSPSLIRLTESQIATFLEGIECPVCLVKPDEGLDIARELIDSRVNAVEDIEVVHSPGGHYPHLEYPEMVAELLNKFYQRTFDPNTQKG